MSGEAAAAIEFLCEQLPSALDLCLLIEEKLRLERELAERERLAVLGQMAASISHNLKNPLGSIKTILQVQLENPEVPESIRGETRMVLEEVRRLSAKLNQLLQFSRPAVRGGAIEARCDARAVAEEVVSLLRHEAEERGIALCLKIVREQLHSWKRALRVWAKWSAIWWSMRWKPLRVAGACDVNLACLRPRVRDLRRRRRPGNSSWRSTKKCCSRFSRRNRRARVWGWRLWRVEWRNFAAR